MLISNDELDYVKSHILPLKNRIKLVSLIIDEWGNAVRLIYGIEVNDLAAEIHLKTDNLNQFKYEGLSPLPFVTSLCYPNEKQKITFEGVSKSEFLNIKSLEQYKECFVRWINTWCHTKDDIEKELNLVEGFRLIYYKGLAQSELEKIEKDLKNDIKDESKKRMNERIGLLELLLQIEINEN